MSNLINESVKLLNKSLNGGLSNPIAEKNLSDKEVGELIADTLESVQKIIDDLKRPKRERDEAKEVHKWVHGVRKTFDDEGKLHPNVVVTLMKTNTGVNSGRFGYAKSGFNGSPSGKVPNNFSSKSESFQRRMREEEMRWKLNDRFKSFVKS